MFAPKKYLYIYLLIQLIFSFFFSLQSFALEHDIYFYPANGDVYTIMPDTIYKNQTIYLNEIRGQYLQHQTPYLPEPQIHEKEAQQIEKEKDKQQKDEEKEQQYVIENDIAEEENISQTENIGKIVIIIDDMGVNRKKTQKISELQHPITASFLTYAPHLKEQIAHSQNSGHEIMVHVPMEPNVMQNYTDQMLTTNMSDEEIVKILENMLQQIPQAVGINNHMGSKFTEDAHRMGVVMKVLAEKDLIFVDSRTSAQTAGYDQSKKFGTKFFARDIFLDNENDYDYIMSQLKKVEKIAHEKGYAIAIGHPKEQTYQTLKDWLPSLKEKNLQLITISQMEADSQTQE